MIIEYAIAWGITALISGKVISAIENKRKSKKCNHNFQIADFHRPKDETTNTPTLVCCSTCGEFSIRKYICTKCDHWHWYSDKFDKHSYCHVSFSRCHKKKIIHLSKEESDEIILKCWPQYKDKIISPLGKILLEENLSETDPLKEKFDELAKQVSKNEIGSLLYKKKKR